MNKASDDLPAKVEKTRAEVAAQFLSGGRGIEVGASSRPFPVPPGIQVIYGDIHEAPISDKNPPASAHPRACRGRSARARAGDRELRRCTAPDAWMLARDAVRERPTRFERQPLQPPQERLIQKRSTEY